MTCPVCFCFFCVDAQDEPPDAHPNRKIYCSGTCKKRAKKHRKDRRDRREFFHQQGLAEARAERCEAQAKVRYPSRKVAMVELRRLNTTGGYGLRRAYPCGDHWHLTRQRLADAV